MATARQEAATLSKIIAMPRCGDCGDSASPDYSWPWRLSLGRTKAGQPFRSPRGAESRPPFWQVASSRSDVPFLFWQPCFAGRLFPVAATHYSPRRKPFHYYSYGFIWMLWRRLARALLWKRNHLLFDNLSALPTRRDRHVARSGGAASPPAPVTNCADRNAAVPRTDSRPPCWVSSSLA